MTYSHLSAGCHLSDLNLVRGRASDCIRARKQCIIIVLFILRRGESVYTWMKKCMCPIPVFSLTINSRIVSAVQRCESERELCNGLASLLDVVVAVAWDSNSPFDSLNAFGVVRFRTLNRRAVCMWNRLWEGRWLDVWYDLSWAGAVGLEWLNGRLNH